MPESGFTVMTDRRALCQILINLANNAIKFTERGLIRLEIRQRGENGAATTEFLISDTGIGISAEDQTKLFQAFSRLNTPGARRSEGTGLGLHLSQKLAGIIGGHITMTSEYGQGSCFTLVLRESGKEEPGGHPNSGH